MNRHGNLSRFRALADAIREHERVAQERAEPRARDQALYRKLLEIERTLPHRDLR